MRISGVLWLLVLVPAVPAQDERPAPDATRIAELAKENLALKRRLAELENTIDQLSASLRGRKYTMTITVPGDGETAPAHLQGIHLPEKPDKEEIRLYVARILRAARRHRGGYGATDAEVSMLEKVGPAHVDVLIEPLLYETWAGDLYLIEALKSLVREEHKELVLRTLPLARDLVQIVRARHWTEDAAPILLEELADRSSWTLPNPDLPTEWIEAVVDLKRADSADALRTYFYYAGNRYATWSTIHEFPGLELGEDVARLWAWARELHDHWIRSNLAAVAAQYGHRDALAALFEDPGSWPARDAIERATTYRGQPWEPEEAKKWFASHRDRLVFDQAARTWRLEEGDRAR